MRHVGFAILATLVAGGCVYDSSDRCGTAMRFDAATGSCVCEENAVADGLGCKACAPDEVVVSGACGCPDGQAKDASNVCAAAPGLGDPCTTAADCMNPDFPVCAPASAGSSAGTCTNSCATNDDCAAAYTCADWESAPYCRQYSGVGRMCSNSSECAGTDAPMCDTFVTHTCIVVGCSLTTGDCPRGTQCCDLSKFGLGTLCGESCP